MSDVKGDASKVKTSKPQKAAAAVERRRRQAEELSQRRAGQLQAAEEAMRQAEEPLRVVQTRVQRRHNLADHLQTFYTEVDKLAKGNRQVEATDLTVQQANDVIRDAREIVTSDAYLDRVKEFVPAGENPVYPDVLIVLATVQAALRRAQPVLAEQEKRYRGICRRAGTIAAAVRLMLEDGEQPLKGEVEAAQGEKPASSWFYKAENGEVYFDIGRLDESDLKTLFAVADED